MKPEFALSDFSKAREVWFGMLRAVRSCIREEAESDGLFSAFLYGIAGYALLFLMVVLWFSFALVSLLNWAQTALEQFAPSNPSRRQWQPTNEFSPPA